MHCNGQCQVMKKIREEEKKQQDTDERKMGSKVEVLSSRSFYASFSKPFFPVIALRYLCFDDATVASMPRSVFHPPSTLG